MVGSFHFRFGSYLDGWVTQQRYGCRVLAKFNVVLAGSANKFHLVGACINANFCAVLQNTNNWKHNVGKVCAVHKREVVGKFKRSNFCIGSNFRALAVEVDVVDVHCGRRFSPTVQCAFGAGLELEFNNVDTCIKLRIESEFVVDAVQRCVGFPWATTLEHYRCGNCNFLAVDCNVQNGADLQRLHDVATVGIGAVCILQVAVATTHCDCAT